MSDWPRELNRLKERVDRGLIQYLPPAPPFSPKVRRAMAYSLLAGGKRIRPLLCLLACRAVGGAVSRALPAACALEFIHTYSLIHDDLPALDDDDFRRGRPTCHRRFGEATAILAGDGLLTEAFGLLARKDLLTKVPAEIRLRVIGEIAEAAGIRGMIAGQEADLKAEGKRVSKVLLEKIHRHKTGALIRASLIVGGLIGGGRGPEIRALADFGKKIGLAFQIKDDLLNVEGQTRVMGKRTGTDEQKSKATYPLLWGLERSKIIGAELIREARDSLRPLGRRGEPLIRLGEYIFSRDR